MDATQLFPSNYITGSDIGEHRPIVTIASLEMEEMGQEKELKPVLYFDGKEKGLVCNKTKINTLIGMFGPETDAWVKRSIQLCSAPVTFQGKTTLGVGILPAPTRAVAPAQKAAAAPVSDMASEDVPF